MQRSCFGRPCQAEYLERVEPPNLRLAATVDRRSSDIIGIFGLACSGRGSDVTSELVGGVTDPAREAIVLKLTLGVG